jgi:ABC-type amino acid transport substrate-binding protein
MKKLLAVCLTATLVVGMVAGCGSNAKTAKVIEVDLTNEEYAFGVDKDQPELLEEVNAFIKEIKEDGTLDEICDKYFGGAEPTPVESAKLDESKDQLVVATNAAFEPFEYTKGDAFVGIDMELAALLAEKLGKELVIQNMDFDAVCLSVGQHKCDIAIAGLTVSDDRKEHVTFTDSYYKASQRLIVPSEDTTFDDMKDAKEIEEKLNELTKDDKIGVQQGTTAQSYIEGSEDFGFAGLPATCQPYKSGSLAVQDMLNGNIKYVIIDAAPASAITESINELQ